MKKRTISLILLGLFLSFVLGVIYRDLTYVNDVVDNGVPHDYECFVEELENYGIRVESRTLPSNMERGAWIQHWSSFVHLVRIQIGAEVVYMDCESYDNPIFWALWVPQGTYGTIAICYP